MLPNNFCPLCAAPVAYAFVVPVLRQEREGRAPHCVGVASEIKSWATRPPPITDSLQRHQEAGYPVGDGMPTPQEFIEDWPLYTRAEVLNFDPPKAISRRCEGECEKETTWSQIKTVAVSTMGTSPDFQAVSYVCSLCGKENLIVLYRKIDWHRKPELGPAPRGYYSINEWEHGAVQKIGQVPAPSIDIDPQLQKRLGSEAFTTKKVYCAERTIWGLVPSDTCAG